MKELKNTKKAFLSEALLGRLVKGVYPPGGAFPTCDDLMNEFSVSRSTVQQVLQQLIQDGFVLTDGRRGTKVVEFPPNLYRFVLVYPVTSGSDNQFWSSLKALTEESSDSRDVQWDSYCDVDQHVDNPAYRQLTYDIMNKRLAGLVMVADPYLRAEAPNFEEFDIPKVRLLHASELDAPLIDTDSHSFIELAVERLRSKGCRRVAVLNHPPIPGVNDFKDEILASGMETHDHWLQMAALEHPEMAVRIMQLLFSGPSTSRPDGLIIADDNLIEYALSGVLSAGVNIPSDVQVVAHCNWPQARPSAVPIDRLGYDVRTFLDLSCKTLRELGKNKTVPELQLVPATYELTRGSHP